MVQQSSHNIIYRLHHAIDPVTLKVTDRVLKLKCFSKAHQHFKWDMLNDIGVINLLRREYLRHGNIVKVFDLYQGTRLDNRSHRYESLFALLIVTIVGTVVAGVILDNYRDNKKKLLVWLKRMKDEAGLFGINDVTEDIFALAFRQRNQHPLLNKFCSCTAEKMKDDFKLVLRCYIARSMLDEGDISYPEYCLILDILLRQKDTQKHKVIVEKFCAYEDDYALLDEAIDPKKVFLAIDAYGKGTLIQRFESVGGSLDLPKNTDTARLFKGIPASPGAVIGIAHLLGQLRKNTLHPIVLVADSRVFSPDDLESLTSSKGVVTTNCGLTGHIPVTCRGIGIGCVILPPFDFECIRNADPIGLCGTTGIVGTGLLVDLKK